MAFKLFGGGGSDRLAGIEEKVQTMLRHDRHEFDLAMGALLGEHEAGEVNRELRATDQDVNRLEREIRREILVHTSVFGGIETPVVLVYMSIVKDIERVGDYCKNLLDLARDGANFSEVPDAEEWRRLTTELLQYITDAGAAFQTRGVTRCRELLSRGDKMLDYFDERVSYLVKHGADEPQAVARALAYRYLKRVVAHLTNLLSAVVMPMDRLDYYDEDPEDRSGR
jgi:phosphate uptake regulator